MAVSLYDWLRSSGIVASVRGLLAQLTGASPAGQVENHSGGKPPVTVRQAVSPNEIFTPTRPRAGRRKLVGRERELARILEALLDDSAHVVLYSERGRGKTSLSNLAVEQLRRRGAVVARCACDAETSFDAMLHMLVRDIPASLMQSGAALAQSEGCESVLPAEAIRPVDVVDILGHLSCELLIFIVDEFDRMIDAEARTRLADTIKTLSDRGIRLYFMVVGVSETLEQIIGQHPSIQRNIVGVHLPLLKDEEIQSMLLRGGQQGGIGFTPEAIRTIQFVARGMPYMAQLMGLRVAQGALQRSGSVDEPVEIATTDISRALDRLIEEANSSVVLGYRSLTSSGADAVGEAELLRLACADQDQWGRMVILEENENVFVGGCRLSVRQWRRLLGAQTVVQPEGPLGPAQIRDRPLIYHVLLLAARKQVMSQNRAGSAEMEVQRT